MVKQKLIYRIEMPESGAGMYSRFRPRYSGRSLHPAAFHPSPRDDDKLVQNFEQAGGFYKQGFKNYPKDCPWRNAVGSWGNPTSPWFFGFPSLKIAWIWVNRKTRAEARDCGLALAIYGVHPSAAIIGDTQAVFFMPCARRLEVRAIPT